MNTTGSSPSAEMIEEWLIENLAGELAVAPGEIDVTQPFAEFGIGSIQAVRLAGLLEDWLGRALPATLLWDYPNVSALATALGSGAEVALLIDDSDW